MNKILTGLILVISAVACIGSAAAAAVPVSPSGSGATTCPTFSWGAAENSPAYRLEVYEQITTGALTHEQMQTMASPVLAREIPASALSWTPSSGQCLGDGQYVWYVKGLDAEGNGTWSEGAAFRVEPVLSSAAFDERVAAAVEKYVARQQALAAAGQAGNAIYQIVPSNITDEAGRQKAAAQLPGITPNAVPTTGASIYLEGDVSMAKTGGRVGIGTDAIGAGLHVTSNEGVLFEGAGGGAIPKEGAGARMMWYPKKEAFRAGYVSASEWDDANIGYGSTAMGGSTTASGTVSTAMGYSTTASGSQSTAMGVGTTASVLGCTAMGGSTTASGFYSTSMGYATTASGAASTAMGNSTTASGQFSTATGSFTTAASFAETVMGQYNTPPPVPGNAVTWVAEDRLFVIGNGTADNARSNAMVVLKNGNVGIGGSPSVKLDVSGTVKAAAGGAADTGMIVQGAASQTASLQEWQDSAGTVLASISPSGIFTTNAPKVRAYFSSAGTSIVNNTTTAMNFDAEAYDIGNIHDNANPSRFTVPVTGYYRMSAIVWFQTNSTGFRQLYLKRGGTVNLASALIPAVNGANTMMVITTAAYLSAGDYVEVYALQNSGGDLTAGGGSDATHFTMEYIP